MDPTRNTVLEGGTPAREGGTTTLESGTPARDGTSRRPRLVAIDAARGVAVVAMVVFHAAWDLSELNLIETEISLSQPWQWFARAIAASFLLLVGIGLALAHRGGVRIVPFLRRVGMVAAAAALITVATVFAFPSSYIFFGVLHNIALSSLLALPLIRAPVWLVAPLSAAILSGPLWLAGPAFDAPLLAWLGLGVTVPITNDYVPVFPWTGFVFAGLAAGRLWLTRAPLRQAAPPDTGRSWTVGRLLPAIGRRSLAIYLLHQPLIFGALWGLAQVVGPNPVAEAAPFLRNCVAVCGSAGRSEALCRASCDCTVAGLRREGIWPSYMRGNPTTEQVSRASEIAQACIRPGAP